MQDLICFSVPVTHRSVSPPQCLQTEAAEGERRPSFALPARALTLSNLARLLLVRGSPSSEPVMASCCRSLPTWKNREPEEPAFQNNTLLDPSSKMSQVISFILDLSSFNTPRNASR